MPTIIFASPKGGVGKSTSALVLATEFAEAGRAVTMLDCDPNRPISRWAKRPGKPATLTVRDNVTEETIISVIEEAAANSDFVVVDLEGTASVTLAYAISRADLVVIPSQGSQLDAAEAGRAVRLVRKQEEAFRLIIPAVVLFTRTSAAILTRDLKRIRTEFETAGVTVLETSIVERAAYRALFAYGGTLSALDPTEVSGIGPAVENAKTFAAEVVALLKSRGVRPEQEAVHG